MAGTEEQRQQFNLQEMQVISRIARCEGENPDITSLAVCRGDKGGLSFVETTTALTVDSEERLKKFNEALAEVPETISINLSRYNSAWYASDEQYTESFQAGTHNAVPVPLFRPQPEIPIACNEYGLSEVDRVVSERVGQFPHALELYVDRNEHSYWVITRGLTSRSKKHREELSALRRLSIPLKEQTGESGLNVIVYNPGDMSETAAVATKMFQSDKDVQQIVLLRSSASRIVK